MNQHKMPLLQRLTEFASQKPVSLHVPGHKNGSIFPDAVRNYFASVLPIDVTELSGMDDLHAPQDVIKEAQQLAAEFFGADATFFLVGGSTAGNLAMILTVCHPGDVIIVQRNSHKSIMNGLELSGAQPIFISPEYDETINRYSAPSFKTVKQAITEYPEAKAVVLTYPDYFGNTFDLKKIIDLAHEYHIPVLVDEAHGVHFSLGKPFPSPALRLGADIVVQSAHKMAPAMTMASFLHVNSSLLSPNIVAHYLQMLQSSSPSYPLMASLDVARNVLATLTKEELQLILASTNKLRAILEKGSYWTVLPSHDPLKITIQVENGLSGFEVAKYFEEHQVYPELATDKHVLFIHGLSTFQAFEEMEKIVESMNQEYNYKTNHATIEVNHLFKKSITKLPISYVDISRLPKKEIPLSEADGFIAAEALIPYPPGIPVILKGERITKEQIKLIKHLIQQGATIQHQDLQKGIQVLGTKGEEIT